MRDDCDVEDLIDVIEGSRIYIPAIYVINKIDQARAPSPGPVYVIRIPCCVPASNTRR